MAKSLVTYFSLTGNTKRIAEEIFSELEGSKGIQPIENVKLEDIEASDLVFIGFPVHSHSLPFKAETFLKQIPDGKKIALFSTHGSLSGSHLSREALEYAIVLTSRTEVLGTYSCRGKVSYKAMEILSKSPEHMAWAEMAPTANNHPDEDDLEDARVFARHVQTLSAQ
jgi:flavodoxin